MYQKALICARFQKTERQKWTSLFSHVYDVYGHFLITFPTRGANVHLDNLFKARKLDWNLLWCQKCNLGSFWRLETLYTYEKSNASQKSRKRGTTITLPPRLSKIEANCKKTHFRVFTGVARNHSRLMPFHHFP